MTKAKQPRQEPTKEVVAVPAQNQAPTSIAGEVSSTEIEAFNEKIIKMQAEIDGLKKQLAQVVTFIKQKVK